MRSLLGLGLFLSLLRVCAASETWQEKVAREQVGPFPVVGPFTGEFSFGWSNIEAASAKATVTEHDGKLQVAVEGGTTGAARKLWLLGAKHEVTILEKGLMPVVFHQVETYATRTTTTDAVFKPSGLWYLRQSTAEPKPAGWKRLQAEPVRDIVSALFFIRSQALRDKDKVAVAAFPGNSPYFLEATVKGREWVDIAGKPIKAIRLDFEIQRIDANNRLAPYEKFRHGKVWLSDDENRIPLRAEVSIFIGYVYGEVKWLSMTPGARKLAPEKIRELQTEEGADIMKGQFFFKP
ncbi:hypothetical protein BH09VER1_BH09VER1_07070 [soil metagenome]